MVAGREPIHVVDVAGNGDEAGFDAFFREAWDRTVRLAHLLAGPAAPAEDLAQDAFARLHRHWERVEHPGAYLRRAIVSVCRDHFRRHAREDARIRRAGLPSEAVSLEAREMLDALDALPYRQKTVLVLRYYEDWSEAEIAELLDCRPGTVKSLAVRGLERLRGVIER